MENVTTEVTVEEKTPLQIAEDTVKTLSATELAQYIAQLFKDKDAAISANQWIINQRDTYRKELNNWKNSVSEFLKEHIKDNDINVDDLKEFAEEMGIELNKTIRVKFTIDVEGEFTVPLDYDVEDSNDEQDFFNIRIEADPSDNDHEVTSEEWNVNDIRVEEI